VTDIEDLNRRLAPRDPGRWLRIDYLDRAVIEDGDLFVAPVERVINQTIVDGARQVSHRPRI
jgi:hypothetical protein